MIITLSVIRFVVGVISRNKSDSWKDSILTFAYYETSAAHKFSSLILWYAVIRSLGLLCWTLSFTSKRPKVIIDGPLCSSALACQNYLPELFIAGNYPAQFMRERFVPQYAFRVIRVHLRCTWNSILPCEVQNILAFSIKHVKLRIN